MDLQLKRKTAIVTGGTAGIGLAIARALSEEGVEVTIAGRSSKKLNGALSSLPGTVRGIESRPRNSRGSR
jgi:NAD(P)-dependent dehydrogenase (short-subunit alcohol dehydrogenase family)